MARCPAEMIGRQVHRLDRSAVEVSVHRAHGAGDDRHGATTVTLRVQGVETKRAPRKNNQRAAELPVTDVDLLAEYLAKSLEQVSQLVPGPLEDWPADWEKNMVAVLRTSNGDSIAFKVHLGRERTGGLGAVTFVALALRTGDGAPGHAGTTAFLLPGELRSMIAMLHRARERAGAAAR